VATIQKYHIRLTMTDASDVQAIATCECNICLGKTKLPSFRKAYNETCQSVFAQHIIFRSIPPFYFLCFFSTWRMTSWPAYLIAQIGFRGVITSEASAGSI
jgi:hypothetical protein